MKSIIIIVAFAIVGLIISAPAANLVTAISPTTGNVGNVALTFTVATSNWTAGDKIILTTANQPDNNDPSHTVDPIPPTGPISVTLNFPAAGTYNVWVKSTDNSQIAQVENSNPISIVISPVPATDLVTAISPTTGIVGNVDLSISVKTTGWTANDKIILTTGNAPGNNDPSHTVTTTTPTSPISATLNFNSAGTYNVWVKNTLNGQTSQVANSNPISIVISPAPVPPADKPDADLISEITATAPKAEVEAEFTFKLKTSVGLKLNDKIYLSTEATTPTSTDKSVPVGSDTTAATFAGKFTLAKAGAYSAFVTRGSETTKQTAPAITVASSGYITMTLTIVLGLFLF